MGFPDIIFGKCSVCGADGGDEASPSSSADSTSNLETTGSGVILEYYQGELMCKLCKNQKIADAETLIATEKRITEQSFRDKAGFVRTV